LGNGPAIYDGAAQLPDRYQRHRPHLALRRVCQRRYYTAGIDGNLHLRTGESHANADRHSDSYAYGHSNGYAYTDSYANGDSNSYAYTDSYANCHSNSYAYTDSYGYCYSNSYSNGYS